MIPTTNRDAVDHLLEMKNYVDVIIPRGGKSLIKKINQKSKIPVIKHLEGLCHIYVDKEANLEIAKKVIFNSKKHGFVVFFFYSLNSFTLEILSK